ncbi:alpha/beta fold hydrolase [Jeongeupia naejangsanensis]|uniref:Alpha/beta hydrolase n=1 Tax=Jeongeupia naejangsanensis TaxID=613195 RepID=A0ABS2BNC3_9NEIS|nr:alpha/beta fold hydrolase [Jeongeupia naejangsanensis]MBM3117120.1 alpha/beta hydrolase [Jeongeupia naejangsanensis]
MVYRRGLRCALLVLLIAALSACGFARRLARLDANSNEIARNGVVAGTVALGDLPLDHVEIVLLRIDPDGLHLVAQSHLGEGGYFVFMVPQQGRYLLAAFHDRDGNGRADELEAGAMTGLPAGLALGPGVESEQQRIVLNAKMAPLPADVRSALQTGNIPAGVRKLQAFAGRIASLDDARFGRTFGAKGLWAPLDFASEMGIGVYFLAPYRSDRIPVLFVHGIGGYPQQWSRMIASLDGNRFQPWVFQYPSGMRLRQSGDALADLLQNLQKQYGFSRMMIVAHSVGGLVSRQAILRMSKADQNQPVTLFVTLSTPWGGDALAQLGVSRSPVTIPSWQDVAADSEFLRNLLDQRLPSSLTHQLFFGYRGSNLLVQGNSDGTIALSSQLAMPAQQEAARVQGFDETHDSILTSKVVIEAVDAALEQSFVTHRLAGR